MKRSLILLILFCFLYSLSLAQETSKGRISGYMFSDYFYNVTRDANFSKLPNTALKGGKDLNGFQIRRVYFTYDYKISNIFSTRFRLEADQSAKTSNGKIGVFVKDAYLKWKNIFKGSDLIFGISPTPAFGVSESVWGNRFLEKTIMDLRGIVSSRDLSVALKGKFDEQGKYNYWIMIGDGTGNKPETDKYKRYYAHLEFKPVKNLSITLYGDLKARPEINNPANNNSTLSNNDLTYDFFVGYKEKNNFTLGFEGFINTRQNGTITGTSAKDKSGMGLSFFGSYNFTPQLAAVARYDYYDPNTDSDYKGDSRGFIVGGLTWSPDKNVIVSPNVLVETYESLPNGKSFDSSITPRITFYYKFF